MKPAYRLTFKKIRSPRARLRDLRDGARTPRVLQAITAEVALLWDKPTDGPDERPPESDAPTTSEGK